MPGTDSLRDVGDCVLWQDDKMRDCKAATNLFAWRPSADEKESPLEFRGGFPFLLNPQFKSLSGNSNLNRVNNIVAVILRNRHLERYVAGILQGKVGTRSVLTGSHRSTGNSDVGRSVTCTRHSQL